ncbi:MAG: sulfotransferase, partial [Promethearchaeota archaeon]
MDNSYRKPNLFIVGEPRSGTTTLYNYLKSHSQIFFPEPKEPTHFATYHFKEQIEIQKKSLNIIKSKVPKYYHKKDYLDLYKNREEKYLGDASTKYLYSKDAAKRIYKFNPQAKIIALFREPVDFLQSYHSRQLFILNENEKNLIKALSLEKFRKDGKNLPKLVKAPSSLLYTKRLQYSKHIQRFLESFPSNQIKVIIFEDFKRNNMKALSEIYNFL